MRARSSKHTTLPVPSPGTNHLPLACSPPRRSSAESPSHHRSSTGLSESTAPPPPFLHRCSSSPSIIETTSTPVVSSFSPAIQKTMSSCAAAAQCAHTAQEPHHPHRVLSLALPMTVKPHRSTLLQVQCATAGRAASSRATAGKRVRHAPTRARPRPGQPMWLLAHHCGHELWGPSLALLRAESVQCHFFCFSQFRIDSNLHKKHPKYI
jgi:hypothetical protein